MKNKSILAPLIWVIIAVAPWINHIVYCFHTEKYLLLIAGAIVVPVGWLHGVGLFFGWW